MKILLVVSITVGEEIMAEWAISAYVAIFVVILRFFLRITLRGRPADIDQWQTFILLSTNRIYD